MLKRSETKKLLSKKRNILLKILNKKKLWLKKLFIHIQCKN